MFSNDDEVTDVTTYNMKPTLIIAFMLMLAATAMTGSPTRSTSSYEMVLEGENIVFGKAEAVSSRIVIRNLGVEKMIAPDLYWRLLVVWDGKEYRRDIKQTGTWNGPGEIMPKTTWSTEFSLSEYLVPAEALSAGRHTVVLKDGEATSNILTVFVGKSSPEVEASKAAGENAPATISPPVSLQEALRIAQAFVGETNVDVSQHYLASVQLQSESGGLLYWAVRWNPTDRTLKGGWFDIRVTMDKTATLIHGK